MDIGGQTGAMKAHNGVMKAHNRAMEAHLELWVEAHNEAMSRPVLQIRIILVRIRILIKKIGSGSRFASK